MLLIRGSLNGEPGLWNELPGRVVAEKLWHDWLGWPVGFVDECGLSAHAGDANVTSAAAAAGTVSLVKRMSASSAVNPHERHHGARHESVQNPRMVPQPRIGTPGRSA